jgi:hypothetical protein
MRARRWFVILTALTLLAAACTDEEVRPFGDAGFPDAAPESAADAPGPDGAAGAGGRAEAGRDARADARDASRDAPSDTDR